MNGPYLKVLKLMDDVTLEYSLINFFSFLAPDLHEEVTSVMILKSGVYNFNDDWAKVEGFVVVAGVSYFVQVYRIV